jgi:hypothetical protein
MSFSAMCTVIIIATTYYFRERSGYLSYSQNRDKGYYDIGTLMVTSYPNRVIE